MRLWYRPLWARRPANAEYLIRYRSDWVRDKWVEELAPYIENATPLETIALDGRAFVEIYPGPRYTGP
jgi:hypothetical protein